MIDTSQLPLEQATRALWSDQRERWEAGERPSIEEYLRDAPTDRRDALTLELIYGEFLIRQEQGDSPNVDEYVRRFPDLEPAIRRQHAFDAALSSVGSTRSFRVDPYATVPASEPAEEHPESIGNYTIVETLACGSQATAFRAIHPTLGRDVVIKLGHDSMVNDTSRRDRIVEEGRVLAELDHPNLARVYDCGFENGRPYLVMEYVPGRTLLQFSRQEEVSADETSRITSKIAAALEVAHVRGIAHLDVKPQNILIDPTGHPKLIDFGLARIEHAWNSAPAREESLAGTIAFMAPEQASSEDGKIGPASDVFGLGGVLYFLLTGKPPIQGDSFEEVLDNAKECNWDLHALSNSGAPSALRQLCSACLSPLPIDRPNVATIAERLKPHDRGPWISRVAILLAIVLAVGSVVVPMWYGDSNRPTETVAATRAFNSPLEIRVFHEGQFINLLDAAPVANSDEVKVAIEVPAGVHAALVLFDSEGQLQLLRTLGAESESRPLAFGSAPIAGPPGTETVIAVGSKKKPIEVDHIKQLLPIDSPWPALRDKTVLTLAQGELKALQQDRAFGPPTERPDPEGEVREFLRALNRKLADKFDHYEVVSFAHE